MLLARYIQIIQYSFGSFTSLTTETKIKNGYETIINDPDDYNGILRGNCTAWLRKTWWIPQIACSGFSSETGILSSLFLRVL